MSETVRLIFTGVFLAAGVVSIALSVFGVFKFKFVMNRMQSAAIIDTLGLSMILIGLAFAAGKMEYLPKLFLILAIQWIGSPLASHMVARLEVTTDETVNEHMETKMLEEEEKE